MSIDESQPLNVCLLYASLWESEQCGFIVDGAYDNKMNLFFSDYGQDSTSDKRNNGNFPLFDQREWKLGDEFPISAWEP
jgi:hypothetical protein